MKSGSKQAVVVALAIAGLPMFCGAAEPITNATEKLSYSIGMSIGVNIKRAGFEVDPEVVGRAIKETLAGGELRMTEQEAQQTIMAYQQELRTRREQERQQLAQKNRAAAEKFLAENKQKPGVKVHEVSLPDGSKAELQYIVQSAGQGASPRPEDTVTFNFKITSLDGKEVDSSARLGQPAKTVLSHYRLAGIKEALQKMSAGAKWQLFLPSSLAFGEMGAPNTEPGSAVICEVELVSFEEPQPLTSDIIKVPSKEELDKGAKIEYIKAEDARKMQQTNSAAGKK